MQQIKSIEDLLSMNAGEKFFVVSSGNSRSYNYIGPHHYPKAGIVAIWDADYTQAFTFSEKAFGATTNTVFLKGKYHGKQIGEIMIAQLQDKIDSIQRIYVDGI